MAHPTGPSHEVGAYHHPSAPAHGGRYLPSHGSWYPSAPPYGSGYSSAPTYGGGTGWYPTGPGHEVGAYHQPSALAHSGRYLPPNGSGYPTAPPYGSGYWSASAYGGGTGWYPTGPAYGSYHAPGYVPYIYTAPVAVPVQQHQNRPVIPGIVAAGIEALAIGVFKAAIANNLFGDGSGFNF